MRPDAGRCRRILTWLLWAFCFCLPALLSAGTAETAELSLRSRRVMSGYAENEFEVRAPADGELTLEIRDENNVYRILEVHVSRGVNSVPWDGLGWNEERLNKKVYQALAVLKTASGQCFRAETSLNLGVSSQALLYALSSGDTVYTEQPEDWFVEFKLVLSGNIITEIWDNRTGLQVHLLSRSFEGGRISSCTLRSLLGSKTLELGSYHFKMYAEDNPRYIREFDLTVVNGSEPDKPVFVTGSVMPGENASDTEIWEKMMMPSVVVDIQPTAHQKVYMEADESSASLGTLHGQTQAVEVLEIRDQWARVTAWNHESAEKVEGWVPVNVLKVEEPRQEYGLLLDKREQTLTLFCRGERVDTLLVSTGRVEKNELYQETAAGSFLTDLHRADFSTNGLRYDYVIRYDGGNLLHQIPYAHGDGKKDYLAGEVYLGAKASHACVRIQAKPGSSGINAYWLWTHLPRHTRLIILDDPAERRGQAAVVQGTVEEPDRRPEEDWYVLPEMEDLPESAVVLTFGGDVVAGGRESYYGMSSSFPALVEREGLSWPFSGLAGIFSRDDLTCINLECVLKDDAAGEDLSKAWRFRGLTSYGDMFPLSSVELVNTANNHNGDYGEEGRLSTLGALEGKVLICGSGLNTTVELDGHLFGFGGCRETTYLKDPGIIERDIQELKELGAEYIIYQCHWGKEYSPYHNALQEAMAGRCRRAGADLVIGHHPHVVQGIGYSGEMPVVYSLGNLCFGGTIQLQTYDAMLVQAVFYPGNEKSSPELRLIPVRTSSRADEKINDYRPVPARGEDWSRILQAVQADTPFPLADRVILAEP